MLTTQNSDNARLNFVRYQHSYTHQLSCWQLCRVSFLHIFRPVGPTLSSHLPFGREREKEYKERKLVGGINRGIGINCLRFRCCMNVLLNISPLAVGEKESKTNQLVRSVGRSVGWQAGDWRIKWRHERNFMSGWILLYVAADGLGLAFQTNQFTLVFIFVRGVKLSYFIGILTFVGEAYLLPG